MHGRIHNDPREPPLVTYISDIIIMIAVWINDYIYVNSGT